MGRCLATLLALVLLATACTASRGSTAAETPDGATVEVDEPPRQTAEPAPVEPATTAPNIDAVSEPLELAGIGDSFTDWSSETVQGPIVADGEPGNGPSLSWVKVNPQPGIDDMDQVQLSSVGQQFYLTAFMPDGASSVTSNDGLLWKPAGDELARDPIGWDSSGARDWTEPQEDHVQRGPFDIGVFSLVVVDDGFLAADLEGWLWFSADGSVWERLASTPNRQGLLFELIPWRGQALARSEDGRTLVAAASTGFSTLQLFDTAPAPSGFSGSIDAGRAGVAYITEFDDEGGPFELVYSPDGVNWHLSPLPDPAGVAYCCYLDMFGVAVGNESVLLLEASRDGTGPLTLWRGTPPDGSIPTTSLGALVNATVALDATGCSSTIPTHSGTGQLGIEIQNKTDNAMAVIMGTYDEGRDRNDLVAYGRDISTRPDSIIAALEIYEVASQATSQVSFDHGPGHYFTACMDTTSTMIVLNDLIVGN